VKIRLGLVIFSSSSTLTLSLFSTTCCCLSFFFFFLMIRRPPRSTLFPTRRSSDLALRSGCFAVERGGTVRSRPGYTGVPPGRERSEEHTSELQSRGHLVCRLLLEKKKREFADGWRFAGDEHNAGLGVRVCPREWRE